ncbi:hypothetical protein [Streptomyces griseorubiginosus]|uniref:hypothetical protein n=1 Tax=Streptomyces griseorubiginosus TaxID=67304 RepID=UPI00332B032F
MSTEQRTEAVPDTASPQAALDVVALHLAQAFIHSGSKEVHAWARGLAHALQMEGVDLHSNVGAHMQSLALGPNDVPF